MKIILILLDVKPIHMKLLFYLTRTKMTLNCRGKKEHINRDIFFLFYFRMPPVTPSLPEWATFLWLVRAASPISACPRARESSSPQLKNVTNVLRLPKMLLLAINLFFNNINVSYKWLVIFQDLSFQITTVCVLLTCSWRQKTNSPIHEFKVLQNVFKIKQQGSKWFLK